MKMASVPTTREGTCQSKLLVTVVLVISDQGQAPPHLSAPLCPAGGGVVKAWEGPAPAGGSGPRAPPVLLWPVSPDLIPSTPAHQGSGPPDGGSPRLDTGLRKRLPAPRATSSSHVEVLGRGCHWLSWPHTQTALECVLSRAATDLQE